MNKPRVLFKTFRLPVFKATVWVVIGHTLVEAIDFIEDKTSHTILSKKDKESTKAYMYAYVTQGGIRRYMIFFNYKAKPGEIAHEVKHLINTLFSWHGFKLSISNDEMECYYLEDIVDKVHSYLKNYRNKFH